MSILVPTRPGSARLDPLTSMMDEFFDDINMGMLPWGRFQPFPMMHGHGSGSGPLSERGDRRGAQQLGGIPVDLSELGDHFELKASLPGVKKDQVKLEVDADVIKVSAGVKREAEYESPEGAQPAHGGQVETKWHRTERVREFASRCLRMPDSADLQNISAKMEDGVLHVNIAKKPEYNVKQQRIIIE